MDKALFKEKIDSMMPELMEGITKECARLYDCGGVDTESYEDDFTLPKIILATTLENEAYQYMPFHPEGKKVVKNLRHF